MRKLLTRLSVAAAALVLTPQLHGQVLLNYTFSYATSGVFACNAYYAAYCSASGNSVTVTNGGSVLTVNFTGTSDQATVNRGDGTNFTIGTLSESLMGPDPFLFPYDGIAGIPIFYLAITIGETGPVTGGGGWSWWAFPIGVDQSTVMFSRIGSDYTSLPIPAGYTRSELLATTDADSYPLAGDGSPLELTGHFNIVPEPNTIVLVATGLGMLAIGGLRSRRSGRREDATNQT
jgi:hypothetical protein